MAQIPGNENSPNRHFGDSWQLTNCILYSGATWHMMPHIFDFIPGSLKDTDKDIEFVDGHHAVAKQKDKFE